MSPYIQIGYSVILEAARWAYGPTTELWPNDTHHAYGWAAKKPGDTRRYPVDLKGWCRAKYGADWQVVQTGFDEWGWQFFHPYRQDWQVVPVILFAKDTLSRPIAELNGAAETFHQNCLRVADWYEGQGVGRLTVMRPTLFGSDKTAVEWQQLYMDQADRYDSWKVCQADLLRFYGNRINSNLIYVCTQYCGATADWDYDAAGGGWLTFVSSFATLPANLYDPAAPTPRAQTVAYAIGHELGHCLGLQHTDASMGNASGIQNAIMQRGMPPLAVLVPYEKDRLATNPFLKR